MSTAAAIPPGVMSRGRWQAERARAGRFDNALAGFRRRSPWSVEDALVILNGEAGDLCRRAADATDCGDFWRALELCEAALAAGPDTEAEAEAELAALYLRSVARACIDGLEGGLPAERFWRGEDPAGKTLLLTHSDLAGYGDVIQYIRRVPALAARGVRVVLRTWPQLFRLLRSCEGLAGLADRDAPPPPFDSYCPLNTLSSRAHVGTVRRSRAYLKAEAPLVERFRRGLAGLAGLKIGFAHHGKITPCHQLPARCTGTDPRALPLWFLGCLRDEIPGITMVSLLHGTKGPRRNKFDK